MRGSSLGGRESLVNGLGNKGLREKSSYINGSGKPVKPKKKREKKKILVVMAMLFVLLTSSMVILTYHPNSVASNGFALGMPIPYEKSYDSNLVNMANYIGKPDLNEKIWITLSLKWRNEPQLEENLRNINDPHSPQYHHFYTWGEFRKMYAPPPGIYDALVEWVKSKGLHIQSTTPMRNSIIIYDTMGKIAKAFNTEFGLFGGDGEKYNRIYYANLRAVELPENIIPYMYGVKGFNNATRIHKMFYTSGSYQDMLAYHLDGVTINRRYPTGADAEKLYHVFELYNDSATAQPSTKHIFATGLRVATVLWEGSDRSGRTQYAPFDPNAVRYYYYKVTPTWIQNELTAEVGYNVSQLGWYGTSGTVAPGSNTDSGVSPENELDLEMVGTLAPGVEAYCVYGPGKSTSPSETNFPDPEYDYILSTLVRQTDRTLVSISNSWGTYGDGSLGGSSEPDIQALNALGVTVFASSGDDAANMSSIPANVATDTYGVVAVGGTTPIPDGTDHTGLDDIALMAYNINFWNKPNANPKLDEAVWYDTTGTTSNNNYWGTQCGISSTYSEPNFQTATIGSRGGRVAADISAIANRTIIYLSNAGSPGWYLLSGTSVASPTMAGVFAEMAAYVGREYGYGGDNIRGFGWIDPTLYYLGYDYYHNGKYSSMPPFWDVSRVWPTSYPSDIYPGTGYDMPTGWGVPNAWNLTHDIGFIMTTEQGQRTVNAGESTWYNLKVWYPYGWNTTVGHYQVYGLPSGATASFNVSYVNAQPWLDNATALSNLNLSITTTTSTPTGTYTIYVVGYTVNETSGHWGNLTYNVSLTLVVNPAVPEFSTTLLLPILILFVGFIAVWRRKRF